MKKISKHYHFSEETVNKIAKSNPYKKESEYVEYLINKGLSIETEKKEYDLLLEINKSLKEIGFIKRLLIQLFVNKGFKINKNSKEDESYQEFIKKLKKDNIYD